MNWRIPEVRQRYTTRDTILYAQGGGPGHDPLDERQSRFVCEKNLYGAIATSFRAQVLERDVIALSNGRAVLRRSGE